MDVDGFPPIRTAAVLGLGLMGGSIARDLAARGVRVQAWDRDAAAVERAVDAGVVLQSLLPDPTRVREAELVVFALPVLEALRVLCEFAPHLESARLVMDVGSTKTSIVRLAEALGIGGRFVGSHPLTGDHHSGWDASRAGLFADARVLLSPTRETSDDAMRLASALWTSLGARPEVIDADEHDRRLAWTSHLPQLTSSALGAALAGQGIARGELGPGGRDATRLAGSSPEMWADIAFDNADALLPALEAAEQRLRDLRSAIAHGSHARLRDLLADARAWHERG